MISKFEEIVKKCGKLCRGDLCFPGGIRNMLDSFEFDRQDAVYLWAISERVFTKFHGDAENFYCFFFMVYCKIIYCPTNAVGILP